MKCIAKSSQAPGLAGTQVNRLAFVGGEAIHSRIIETVRYSPAAREAQERYNIHPYRVPPAEEDAGGANEIYLGLVFTCGSEEFVIPFFDRGLPAEYELVRSIRVVSRAKRKKVGIVSCVGTDRVHRWRNWPALIAAEHITEGTVTFRQQSVIVAAFGSDREDFAALPRQQHLFLANMADKHAAIGKVRSGNAFSQIGAVRFGLVFSHLVLHR